jgi:hypothetical protein
MRAACVDAIDEEPHPTITAQGYMREYRKAHEVVERMRALGLGAYCADPVAEITRAEDELRRARAAETPLRIVATDGEPPSAA